MIWYGVGSRVRGGLVLSIAQDGLVGPLRRCHQDKHPRNSILKSTTYQTYLERNKMEISSMEENMKKPFSWIDTHQNCGTEGRSEVVVQTRKQTAPEESKKTMEDTTRTSYVEPQKRSFIFHSF